MIVQCLLPGFRFFFFACKRMTANTTPAASTVLPSEMAMSPPAVFFRLREAGSETSALAATTSSSPSIFA